MTRCFALPGSPGGAKPHLGLVKSSRIRGLTGGAGAGCYEFHVGRGLAVPGSVMKSLIKNVLIGFGVGLVLMTGLALVTGGGKAQSSVHAPR